MGGSRACPQPFWTPLCDFNHLGQGRLWPGTVTSSTNGQAPCSQESHKDQQTVSKSPTNKAAKLNRSRRKVIQDDGGLCVAGAGRAQGRCRWAGMIWPSEHAAWGLSPQAQRTALRHREQPAHRLSDKMCWAQRAVRKLYTDLTVTPRITATKQ